MHLTQIVNEQVTTLHLCERCAAEKGVESPGAAPRRRWASFLRGHGQERRAAGGRSHAGTTCPRCGAHAPGLPRKRPARLRASATGPSRCRCATCCAGCTARPTTWGALHRRGRTRRRADRPQAIELREQLRLRRRDRELRAGGGAARPAAGAGMIDLSLLTDGGVGWLDASGPSSHWCCRPGSGWRGTSPGASSRAGTPRREREDDPAATWRRRRGTPCCCGAAVKFRLDRLERADRQLLHERHLVSKELAGLDADGRVRNRRPRCWSRSGSA